MRWLIAGLFFALAVSLTIATAALRAQNIAERRLVQRVYDAVQDRDKDLIRLGYEGLEAASEAGPDIANAIARADSAMATLVATGESLEAATSSLSVILERVERGEGTLGRLSTDETLYVSLNDAAASLNSLLMDLQANPNKYINISIF